MFIRAQLWADVSANLSAGWFGVALINSLSPGGFSGDRFLLLLQSFGGGIIFLLIAEAIARIHDNI